MLEQQIRGGCDEGMFRALGVRLRSGRGSGADERV